jgi:hypothetical protein
MQHASRAEQSRAEQSRAEQSRAEQSRAEQSRAEQSRAEQSRAEQRAIGAEQPAPQASHFGGVGAQNQRPRLLFTSPQPGRHELEGTP